MQTPKKNPKTFLKQSRINSLPTITIIFLLPQLINSDSKAFNPQAIGTLEEDVSFEYFHEDLQFLKLMKILNFDNLKVRAQNPPKLKKEFQVRNPPKIILTFLSRFWIS